MFQEVQITYLLGKVMSSKHAMLFPMIILLSLNPTDSLIDDNYHQFYSDNINISDPPLSGFDQDLSLIHI